jgi:hypothetical protein
MMNRHPVAGRCELPCHGTADATRPARDQDCSPAHVTDLSDALAFSVIGQPDR